MFFAQRANLTRKAVNHISPAHGIQAESSKIQHLRNTHYQALAHVPATDRHDCGIHEASRSGLDRQMVRLLQTILIRVEHQGT
ncbi:unnamed protein product [Ixodes hexagonus]